MRFYTILSQSLVISHNSMSINDLISEIDRFLLIAVKKPDDIIQLFNRLLSERSNINELSELGVGRWMSYFPC